MPTNTAAHSAKTIDIIGFGEPLMDFSSIIRKGESLYMPGHGGDTSNATIAAARQGARTAYFTWMGDDAFGRDFLTLWDIEGVDRHHVMIREGTRTGTTLRR